MKLALSVSNQPEIIAVVLPKNGQRRPKFAEAPAGTSDGGLPQAASHRTYKSLAYLGLQLSRNPRRV